MTASLDRRNPRTRLVLPMIAAAVLVAIGGLVLVVRSQSETPDPAATDYATTVAGLCRAADQAASGDRVGANNTFYDRSHSTLHQIAADVQRQDRRVAARLLETKNRVENELTIGNPDLSANLRALANDARDALRVLGAPVPAGCQ